MRTLVLLATTLLSLGAQTPPVAERPLRAHLAFLADDLLEGRGTGSRGGQLTVAYLEAQLRALGLQPLPGGGYRHPVALTGLRVRPEATHLAFRPTQGEALKPELGPELGIDAVVGTGRAQADQTLEAPLVFGGYGIQAPEEGWDDVKGADLKGKVLLLLVNDPPAPPEAPDRFGGAAMTYYGRWVYKFEQAARLGAAGVLLVHTDASATYGWGVVRNSFSGERFQAAERMGSPLEGWVSEAFARRLCAAAGQDLDALRQAAARADFRPVDLGLTVKGTLKAQVRSVQEANVAGVLPGTDPALKQEAVIFSAHWDHLGMDEARVAAGKDGIYNGAVDNASGCAGLLAMAEAAAAAPPKRSLVFLFVCGEEQGLLGSAAWAARPGWPLDRTALVLNLDSLNPVGPTRDLSLQGLPRTDLGPLAQATFQRLGLKLAPEGPDLGGGYFRSDHFSFVRVGVPALSVGGGSDFLMGAEQARPLRQAFGRRYHQVDEAYDPAMDLRGMVQQAGAALALGYAAANTPERPRLTAPASPGWALRP